MTVGERIGEKWLAGACARVEQAIAGGNPAAIEAAKASLLELRTELADMARRDAAEWNERLDEYIDQMREDGLVEGRDFGVTK